MSDESNTQPVLLRILDQLLLEHPLPWTVERDWTYEVIASDKTIIAKCKSRDEAEAIVDFAEKRQMQIDESCEKGEQFLQDIQDEKEA